MSSRDDWAKIRATLEHMVDGQGRRLRPEVLKAMEAGFHQGLRGDALRKFMQERLGTAAPKPSKPGPPLAQQGTLFDLSGGGRGPYGR